MRFQIRHSYYSLFICSAGTVDISPKHCWYSVYLLMAWKLTSCVTGNIVARHAADSPITELHNQREMYKHKILISCDLDVRVCKSSFVWFVKLFFGIKRLKKFDYWRSGKEENLHRNFQILAFFCWNSHQGYKNKNTNLLHETYKCAYIFLIFCSLYINGPIYFVFCRLYPFSPQPPRQCLGPPVISLLFSNTVSPVRACLIIWCERFRWTQKEDDRGPLSIQSSLLNIHFGLYLCSSCAQICWHVPVCWVTQPSPQDEQVEQGAAGNPDRSAGQQVTQPNNFYPPPHAS